MTNNTSAKILSFKGESSFRAVAELVRIIGRAKSQHDIDAAGRQLLDLARFARRTGEEQICSDASKMVLHLPVSHGLYVAADYYRTISQEELVSARGALVRAVDRVPLEYRARVTYHIGFGYENEGDIAEAARYYLEAIAVTNDQECLSRFDALSGLAYLRSEEGDHAGAVADFEALFPIANALSQVYPALCAEHLNNFAVVLSRAGMTRRAERAINAALASPFAARFPEWRETQREIEETAKQSRHGAPALKMSYAVRPLAARQSARKSPGFFLVVSIKPNSTITRLHPSPEIVVSLLDRYVKTARIRDQP